MRPSSSCSPCSRPRRIPIAISGELREHDETERPDRLAELLPLLRIASGRFERTLRRADRPEPELDATYVQDVEGNAVPLAEILAEQVGARDLDVLERQRASRRPADPELVLLGTDSETRRSAIDDERGELVSTHLGEHGEHVGEAGTFGDKPSLFPFKT